MKRKNFTESKIISILQEARSGKTVSDVCRGHNISENTYYRWKQKYDGLSVRQVHRLGDLEKQNHRLMKLLAQRDLEIDTLKEWLAKNE